jgi:hypothetical protein
LQKANLLPSNLLKLFQDIPMNKPTDKPLLLADTLPAFTVELERLLTEAGESELAAQVATLRIFGRCTCQGDFCSTFYTLPEPKGSFGPNHRCVRLFPEDGSHLVLDVVDGRIACVELLDYEDVHQKLLAALP